MSLWVLAYAEFIIIIAVLHFCGGVSNVTKLVINNIMQGILNKSCHAVEMWREQSAVLTGSWTAGAIAPKMLILPSLGWTYTHFHRGVVHLIAVWWNLMNFSE